MNRRNFLIPLFLILLSLPGKFFAQISVSDSIPAGTVQDTLNADTSAGRVNANQPQIILTEKQAIDFLSEQLNQKYWKNPDDPLRKAMLLLVLQASNPPLDSINLYLGNYRFDSLLVSAEKFYKWDSVRVQIPDTSSGKSSESIIRTPFLANNTTVDSLIKQDTVINAMVDTMTMVSSEHPGFPFLYYKYPSQGDSTIVAVTKLLDFVETRDSSIVYFTGTGSGKTPVWLNSKSDVMKRYWLKNDLNDSVTVWIGATNRNTIGLYLEQGVLFRRPAIQGNYSGPKINVKEVDKSKLLDLQKIVVRQQLWKYRTEASFTLNQTALTNWVKGGESSISTLLDVTGYADYNNKKLKLTSNNFARIKFGLIKSGDNNIRKNIDLIETNSKLNHKAFGKFDFSAVMLFKTQLTRSYNYGKDTVMVSRLFNPATLTLGFGLDYKPDKNTSINFSPLSYKGTFVPDTVNIDQTKYGIAADKRSMHEPGASFMISNEFKPIKTITVVNRLQLFTNYINNPQNIDIDWEMILTANLNWFTDVRFNTHLIFDDDTRTPVLDKNKNPVMVDGKPKKTARVQFKELLGFSLVFRF